MNSSNEEELITVIIPVYKVEEYLEKCVNSVLKQTYQNLEIILVDDGSPDKCGEICDKYAEKDKRVKVIHKENGGLSDARNAGIDIARGKYITFIDSDDYVENDYIETLFFMVKNDNTKMAICSHRVIYDTGKIIDKQTLERKILRKEIVLDKILYDQGIDLSTWAKLYDISLFENIRFPKGRLYEDSATTYLLIDLCNEISLNSISKYNYVIRRNSITNNKFNKSKMDLIISTKEMTEYISKKYPKLKKACQRRMMYAYLSTLSQLVKDKESNNEEKKIIMDYINEHRRNVLKDERIPRRDRLALYFTKGGAGLYKIMWNIYTRMTNRI